MKSPHHRVALLIRNFGSFCSNNKHDKHQMALAAAESIRYIISLSMEQNKMWNQLNLYQIEQSRDFKKCPLSDNIIKHLQGNRQISSETLNKFKEMFDPTKGVVLPFHLLTQKRIQDGLNSNGKFSFFPNRIVTTPIFRIIYFIKDKTLVHGNAGISKTISFIYYSYLAQFITSYELEFNESIAKDIPRLLYFSYENKQQPSELLSHLSKMIRSHFPQKFITENNLLTQFNPNLLYLSLQRAIKTQIQFKVIVDQFNSFSAQCRQFNTAVKEKTFTNANRQWLTFEKQKWFYSAAHFTQKRVIFNSSQNLEQSVVGRAEAPKICFDINHHSDANNFNIDFFKNNQSVDTHRQIIYLLFFELLRMTQSEKVKKAKQTFLKVANNKNFEEESFITPYQIRKYLQAKRSQTLKEIKQINFKDESKVMDWIIEIVTQIGNINIDDAKESAKKFSEEGTQQLKAEKLVFIMDVRRILQKRREKKEQNQMKKQELEIFDMSKPDQDWFRFPPRIQIVNKKLFEVTADINDDTLPITQFRLKFSVNDFFEITNSQKQKFINILKKTDSQSYKLVSKYITEFSKGQFFDSIFVQILQSYHTSFQYYDQKKKQNIHFFLQPAKTFQQFNQTKYILDLKVRFQSFLGNQQIVCGIPITKANQQKSQNSASFDFIIITNQEDGSITVNSWDLTIQKSNSTKKLNTSFKKIKNILDHYYDDKTKPDNKNRGKTNDNKKEPMLIIKQWNHNIMSYPQIYSQKTVTKKWTPQISTTINCYNSNIQNFVIMVLSNQGNKSIEEKIQMEKDYIFLNSCRDQILSAIKTK